MIYKIGSGSKKSGNCFRTHHKLPLVLLITSCHHFRSHVQLSNWTENWCFETMTRDCRGRILKFTGDIAVLAFSVRCPDSINAQ